MELRTPSVLRLFDVVNTAAPDKISGFNPQDIANLAWAMVKAEVEAPELFRTLATAAGDKISGFNPQNIANLAWAMAKAEVEADAALQEVRAATAIA